MLALVYDVHGNLPALEAVLADAERSGVDRFVFGGDFVTGPMPAGTFDRVTGRYPELLEALQAIPGTFVLDAEVLAFDGERAVPFTTFATLEVDQAIDYFRNGAPD